MLRHTLARAAFKVATRRTLSTASEPSSMVLNFCLPHETVYSETKVSQVIVPGAAGEYGITADHVPVVAQLKPGVLQIFHDGKSGDPESFFVPGGFSITHPNSVTDITCPEALKLDDIDPAAVSSGYDSAKAAFSSAETGSIAQAEAQVEMEVNRAMGAAIGVALN